MYSEFGFDKEPSAKRWIISILGGAAIPLVILYFINV